MPKFNEASYAHFITTKTFENQKVFRNDKYCEILIKDIDFYRNKLGFKLVGYCMMPDHLHIIMWWDVDVNKDLTISKIIQSIKNHSAKEIEYYFKMGRRKPSLSPHSKAGSEGFLLPKNYQWKDEGTVHTPVKGRIWQHDFYDFNIYSDKKMNEKLNYIHWNPVRAGLCNKPEDWLWSSYKFYEFREEDRIKIDIIR
ncbi:transposase [Patescibacteria group bacterium]|nr:transposase [Patescibacteria group bacterium]